MRTRAIGVSLIFRLLVAALLAVGGTVLVERIGPVATTVVLFVLLTAAFWLALSLLLALLASRRLRGRSPGGGRRPRWWWPFGRNRRNGRGQGGVREPRRPRPPFFPPRAAAVEPDAVSSER
ncbi:MAG TPA: hypothetical protein VKT52_04040 [Ktedonobacterales bacterium]|nr:hypothetical protein [Ktedonobacterales bacterium]